MSEFEVRPIESSGRARAITVLTLSFATDPVMRWAFPKPDRFVAAFERFAGAFLDEGMRCGSAFEVDDFGGVALWLPETGHMDDEALAQIFIESIDPDQLEAKLTFFGEMIGHHIEQDHWYLAILGVDPARQGQGLGSVLLEHVLKTVDGAALPAYLESSNPRNVPLYARHGFEVTAKLRGDDAPIVHTMLRGAR